VIQPIKRVVPENRTIKTVEELAEVRDEETVAVALAACRVVSTD
jgi:hypothetical protein